MDGTLSDKFKDEITKLKGMTFKVKIDYIWEYYRIPIIGIVIFLALLGSIINSVLNPPKKVYAQLSIYGPYVDTEVLDRLAEDITGIIVDDKENYAVYAANFYESPTDIEINIAMQQKFFAMISTREIDVIVGAEEDIGALAVDGSLLELNAEMLAALGYDEEADKLLNTPTIDNEESATYAIMLRDSEVMLANGLQANEYFMGLIVNSSRINEAISLMNVLR